MRRPTVRLFFRIKFGLLFLAMLALVWIIFHRNVLTQNMSTMKFFGEPFNETVFTLDQSTRQLHRNDSTPSLSLINVSDNLWININSTNISTENDTTDHFVQFYPNQNTSNDDGTYLPSEPVSIKRKFVFTGLNKNAIRYFSNVCIEEREQPVFRIEIDGRYKFRETQRIVIYNSPGYYVKNIAGRPSTLQRQTISVAGSDRTSWNHWDVYFTSKSIPSTHTVHSTTAFFIAETLASNLYHFWNDQFVRLYSVIQKTNGLHRGIQNQILYRYPKKYHQRFLNDTVCKRCRRSPFDAILQTLHTTNKFYVFYELPTNTCYTSAVFGARYIGRRMRDSVDHVLAQFNMTYKKRSKHNKSVVIVERQRRRIINTKELVTTLQDIGFEKVRVIDFALIPVTEQLRIVVETDILIGVQGAGLQWAIFMRPRSILVEITWPEKQWRSWYSFVRDYKITHLELKTNDAVVNWSSYESFVGRREPFSESERQRILDSVNTTSDENVWKFADARVAINSFKLLLSKFV